MYLAFSQACTNDKYYDKTAHAQTGPHVCIWRESARALTCVRSKLFLKYMYHKER